MLEPEANEAELLGRPEHDLPAEAREVHGADRRRREVVEREVSVGDRIERVGVGPLEAEVRGERVSVDVPVESGQRPGASRHVRGGLGGAEEAAGVALEHPEIGE